MAQELHQEPRGVAAGSGAGAQGLFRRLHAGLHTDQIANHPLQPLIEVDQEIDGVALGARDRADQFGEERTRGLRSDKSRQILVQFRRK
jgi:hypothetical protein